MFLLPLLTFCKVNYRLVAILAIIVLAFCYGHHLGEKRVQAQWDRQKQADKIATQNYLIKTERQQSLITSEVTDDYENQIAAMDSDYARELERLRSRPANHPLPSATPATVRPVTDAIRCEFSEQDKEQIIALAKEADGYRIQLIALQAWVKKQSTGY